MGHPQGARCQIEQVEKPAQILQAPPTKNQRRETELVIPGVLLLKIDTTGEGRPPGGAPLKLHTTGEGHLLGVHLQNKNIEDQHPPEILLEAEETRGEGGPPEVPSQREWTEKGAHIPGAFPTKSQTGEAELGALLQKPHTTGEGHLLGVALPKEQAGEEEDPLGARLHKEKSGDQHPLGILLSEEKATGEGH